MPPNLALQTHTSRRIEATRAWAALAVVIYHLFVITHGYNGAWSSLDPLARLAMFGSFGVNVFFALSGYLLFRPFVRAALSRHQLDLGRYARNRVVRILPLYYAAVVILLLLTPGGASWDQVWRHLVFAQNLSPSTQLIDGPLWTLICEAEFYLLLPILGFGLLKLAGGRLDRVFLLTGIFAVFAYALSVLALQQSPFAVWDFSLPANLVSFVPGMLLAVVEVALLTIRPHWLCSRRVLFGVLTLSLLAWLWLYFDPVRFVLLLAALFTLGAIGQFDRAFQARTHRFAPLGALGLASYSLYVWHLPILMELYRLHILSSNTFLNFFLALPCCLGIAIASYFVIEKPFLRLRQRWAPPLPIRQLGAELVPTTT